MLAQSHVTGKLTETIGHDRFGARRWTGGRTQALQVWREGEVAAPSGLRALWPAVEGSGLGPWWAALGRAAERGLPQDVGRSEAQGPRLDGRRAGHGEDGAERRAGALSPGGVLGSPSQTTLKGGSARGPVWPAATVGGRCAWGVQSTQALNGQELACSGYFQMIGLWKLESGVSGLWRWGSQPAVEKAAACGQHHLGVLPDTCAIQSPTRSSERAAGAKGSHRGTRDGHVFNLVGVGLSVSLPTPRGVYYTSAAWRLSRALMKNGSVFTGHPAVALGEVCGLLQDSSAVSGNPTGQVHFLPPEQSSQTQVTHLSGADADTQHLSSPSLP